MPTSRVMRFLLGPWDFLSGICYATSIALLCVSLGVIGFRIADQTNHDVDLFDQGAYVGMSQKMEGSWYPWYSDGTRNPLFPWLAAVFLDPGDPAFFEKGKKLNVILAICGTACLGIFFSRRLGPLAALSATALASLAALLPISTFFGAEAAFLVLFFFVCVCGARLLNDNPVRFYVFFGLLLAIAWLAKSSTTLFFGLFILFSFGRWILNLLGANLPWHLRAPSWSFRHFGIGLMLCLLAYFALISPRLAHAKRSWDSAFYSLPSFWFWADDWEACVRKYADCRKVRLAELPPDEQPTLSGYFRRHDAGDALQRLTKGIAVRLGQFFHPEGKWKLSSEKKGKPKRIVLPHRGFYLVAVSLLGMVMGAFAIHAGRLREIGPVTLPVLLGFATFIAYLLATAWYAPIGPGHRFIMTLYLPTLWILAQGGEQFRAAARSQLADILFLAGHLAICISLSAGVVSLLQDAPFEKVSYAF